MISGFREVVVQGLLGGDPWVSVGMFPLLSTVLNGGF